MQNTQQRAQDTHPISGSYNYFYFMSLRTLLQCDSACTPISCTWADGILTPYPPTSGWCFSLGCPTLTPWSVFPGLLYKRLISPSCPIELFLQTPSSLGRLPWLPQPSALTSNITHNSVNDSSPSVSMGDWFQDLPEDTKLHGCSSLSYKMV